MAAMLGGSAVTKQDFAQQHMGVPGEKAGSNPPRTW